MKKAIVFLLFIGLAFAYYVDFGDVAVKTMKYEPYPAKLERI